MDNVIKSILRRLASLEKRPTGSVTVTGGGGGTLDDLTDVTITAPADGEVLTYDNVTGEWVNAAPTGGGGTPGGSDTEVQFNDGGSFGGDSTFTFNKTTNTLTVEEIDNDMVQLAYIQSTYLMTR
jgi:hypothetical protein